MERMTKADFWDGIQSEYPEGMAEFNAWIEEFRRRADWEILFNCGHETNYGPGDRYEWPYKSNYSRHYPRFHNLPNAMQIGIFIQYTIEQGGESFFQPGAEMWTMEGMIQAIRQWFYEEHRASELSNQKHSQ